MFEQQYMLEMVEARRNSADVEERHDLFSGLLKASQDELDNGITLRDEELIGKCPNIEPFFVLETRSQETCLFFFLLDMR
jgi:hypothetical protein